MKIKLGLFTYHNLVQPEKLALPAQTQRFLSRIIAIFTITLVLFIRGRDRILNAQFWAEDGSIFFQDAYKLSFWESITLPYKGYYHLFPRLIAELSLLFQFELVPFIFTISSFLATAFCCSFFLLKNFNWIIPDFRKRFLFCILFAALPNNDEVFLYLLNTQWYFSILCFFMAIIDIPASVKGRIVYIVGWLFLSFTNPSTIIFIPVLALRLFIFKKNFAVLILSISSISILLFNIILESLLLGSTNTPSDIGIISSLLNMLAINVLYDAFGIRNSILPFILNTLPLLIYVIFIPYIALAISVAITSKVQTHQLHLFVWLVCLYCTIAPILLALLGRPEFRATGSDIYNMWNGHRYYILPITALYFLVFWWFTITQNISKALIMAKSVVLLGIFTAVFLDFYPAPRSDKQWDAHAQRIKMAEAQGSTFFVTIPLNPSPDWSVEIKPTAHSLSSNSIILESQPAQGQFDFLGFDIDGSPDIPENRSVRASGWAFDFSGAKPAQEVILVETSSKEIILNTKVNLPRYHTDVSTNETRIVYSGWDTTFPAAILGLGTHSLQVYVLEPQTMRARPVSGELRIRVSRPNENITQNRNVNFVIDDIQIERDAIFGTILPENSLKQEFTANQDNLVGLMIQLATFSRENNCLITIYLQRVDDGNIHHFVSALTLDASAIKDNEFFFFQFSRQERSRDQRYIVTVSSPDATAQNAITAWIQSGDPYSQGNLWAGDTKIEGDVAFKLVYQ